MPQHSSQAETWFGVTVFVELNATVQESSQWMVAITRAGRLYVLLSLFWLPGSGQQPLRLAEDSTEKWSVSRKATERAPSLASEQPGNSGQPAWQVPVSGRFPDGTDNRQTHLTRMPCLSGSNHPLPLPHSKHSTQSTPHLSPPTLIQPLTS